MKKNSRSIKGFGFIILILLFFRNGYSQDSITKLPIVNLDRVHIIENKSFCSAGVGTQRVSFLIDGESVYSNKADSEYLPGVNLFNSPFLRIGCNLNRIVVDYSYFESSFRFQKSVDYEGIEYNVIEFKNNNLYVGYSFSLVSHYFYFDVGMGYSQTQYTLDFTSEGSLRGTDKADLNSSSAFTRFNLKIYVTDYLYFHWLNQKSIPNENGIAYSNQLGINFLVRL